MPVATHLSPIQRAAAVVDCVTISSALSITLGGASRSDIQLFAFLSHLLDTFEGSAPSSWGYSFLISDDGRPFSEALSAVVDDLLVAGLLVESTAGLAPSEAFRATKDTLKSGPTMSRRISLLNSVCMLTAVRGVPGITQAIASESQLARAAAVQSSRMFNPAEGLRAVVELTLRALARRPDEYRGVSPAFVWLDEWEVANAQ